MNNKKNHRLNHLQKIICVGIVAQAAIIVACLLVYLYSSLPEDSDRTFHSVIQTITRWFDTDEESPSSDPDTASDGHSAGASGGTSDDVSDATSDDQSDDASGDTSGDHSDGSSGGTSGDHSDDASGGTSDETSTNDSGNVSENPADDPSSDEPQSEETSAQVQLLTHSGELGKATDLEVMHVPDDNFSLFYVMLDTEMGPMMYYNQSDSRWAKHLYGGLDLMTSHGCGPTAVSMLVSSFSPTGGGLTPIEIADWSSENGHFASGQGSYHSLINDALTAYGLHSEGVQDYSAEHVSSLLESGHVLVALVARGTVNQGTGHFILITKLLDNGNVEIADPSNYENTGKEWELNTLLSELKWGANSGGPLWAVRKADADSPG